MSRIYSLLSDQSRAPSEAQMGDQTALGRLRVAAPVILSESGDNYLAWASVTHFLLRQDEFAWEVTKGTITATSNAENFKKGNKIAKGILINSLHPNTVLDLFYGTEDEQTAATIWKALEKQFSKQTGILKHQHITDFVAFKYNTSETAEQNIHRFKSIIFKLSQHKITLSESMKCAKLIDALPPDWEAMKFAWGVLPEDKQLTASLYEMILGESARRSYNQSSVNQTEALFSKLRVQKSGFKQHRFNRRFGKSKRSNWNNQQSTQVTRDETVITCYGCGLKGHTKWNCPNRKAKSKKQSKKKVAANNAEAFMAQYSNRHDECENEFVVDSGASDNICHDLKWYATYNAFDEPQKVRLGGAGTLQIEGVGTVRLAVCNNDSTVTLELKNVLFVPRMRRNLISVSKLTDDGYKVTCDKSGLRISNENVSLLTKRIDNLFVLRVTEKNEKCTEDRECLLLNIAKGTRGKLSLRLAHRSLGHVNKEKVKTILTREGINYEDDLDVCDACIRGKLHRATYRSRPRDSLPRSPGHVTADLCSITEESIGGSKHFLVIVDEYSRYRKCYFLKSKKMEEVVACI